MNVCVCLPNPTLFPGALLLARAHRVPIWPWSRVTHYVGNLPFGTQAFITAQGETQMQTQEADGWSLALFINPKRGRQENGHEQAKGQNQFRVQ